MWRLGSPGASAPYPGARNPVKPARGAGFFPGQSMGTLTRTGVNGAANLPDMEKTQQGYKLQPLSAFLGKPAPALAPEIKWPRVRGPPHHG